MRLNTKIYLASTAALADEARFAQLLKTVPAARREKVEAMKTAPARRLSLGAGALLERVLAEEGLCAGKLRINDYGKPWFPALPGFHFNLSHSGERVMCAVSSAPVGCDIELPEDYDPELVRLFFHPKEREWLLALPEEARRDAFYRLWTCKESFAKAIGMGLSLPMDSFDVAVGEHVTLSQHADPRPWRLRSFRDGEYFCALCGLHGVDDCPLIPVEL